MGFLIGGEGERERDRILGGETRRGGEGKARGM